MKFTDEQMQAARQTLADYEHRIEMIWDDTQSELAMRLGLDDDQVLELLDEVESS